MKALRILWIGLATLFLAGSVVASETKAGTGFDRLKSLAGEWEGKTADGKAAVLKSRLVSGGSALEETLEVTGEPSMVTVYHLDGGRLMVTHYCSSGNQPRMVTDNSGGDGKRLAFHYLDATNLTSADAGHMHKLVIGFQDADHFTQEWTWHDKGQEKTEVIAFARKK
jgi:hypothetical protein